MFLSGMSYSARADRQSFSSFPVFFDYLAIQARLFLKFENDNGTDRRIFSLVRRAHHPRLGLNGLLPTTPQALDHQVRFRCFWFFPFGRGHFAARLGPDFPTFPHTGCERDVDGREGRDRLSRWPIPARIIIPSLM